MHNEEVGQPHESDTQAEGYNKTSPAVLVPLEVAANDGGKHADSSAQIPEQQNSPPSPFRKWVVLHWEKLKHVGMHEWIMVAATVAMAVSTITYTIYSRKQLAVMQGTLEEMRRNGSDASYQTWQAIGNANWLARSTQYALDQSREAFRIDQRAWVGARSATAIPPFKSDAPNLIVGKPVTIGFIVINSGKTPALHLRGTTDVRILAKGITFVPKYRFSKELHLYNGATLTPGGTLSMMAQPTEWIIDQNTMDELRAEKSYLYLFGSYTYEDTFRATHQTRICMYAIPPDLAQMGSCNHYNEAN